MRLSQSRLGIGTTVAAAALLLSSSGCGASKASGLGRFPEYAPTLTEGPVTTRFLGTSSILFSDSETAILSDGFVSRPRLDEIVFSRIEPDSARIEEARTRLQLEKKGSLNAVFAVHSHYDHAMDAPVFAERTGARLIGSESTAVYARGLKPALPEAQIQVVRPKQVVPVGKFELTFLESRHDKPERFRGVIKPFTLPAHVRNWRTGTTWSVLVRHKQGTALVHASANYKPGALRGQRADVVYLGITGLAEKSTEFVDRYWKEVVVDTGARRVILVHWDNFFHGLDEKLTPLPFVGFERSVERIECRARAYNIDVVLPVAWEAMNPFANLPERRAPELDSDKRCV